MDKSKNPSVNYTFSDRYQRFVSKLTQFARLTRKSNTVDNSPDGIFTGEVGDLLVKTDNKIYYRGQSDADFKSLSDQFPDITQTTSYVLAQGVNKKASWVKTPTGLKSWKLLGYFCPILNVNCCALSGSVSGSV